MPSPSKDEGPIRLCIRKGPNRVGFVGIFQPFRDAIRFGFGARV